jgi:uncharacterized membrane protein YfcA
MSENEIQKYASITKKAWIVYSITSVVIAALLVLFVARDTEEQFFYGLMIIAGAYVFRPSERYMSKLILKFTGISPPTEK